MQDIGGFDERGFVDENTYNTMDETVFEMVYGYVGNMLPCHYFDWLIGTYSGGLIAVMLGRMRMSIPECLAVYRRVGDDVFFQIWQAKTIHKVLCPAT